MDNNIDILDEIHKGCDMGIEAIGFILKKADKHEFRDLLENFQHEYETLSQEMEKLYHEYTDDAIHEVNAPEKSMKDTMFDGSVSKMAEIMINGTVMGIIEGRKILNHKKMDKKVHNLCEKHIKLQEKYFEKLKVYL